MAAIQGREDLGGSPEGIRPALAAAAHRLNRGGISALLATHPYTAPPVPLSELASNFKNLQWQLMTRRAIASRPQPSATARPAVKPPGGACVDDRRL
jgi:hypothetical protein